jgi:hypothetical protein
MMCYDKEIIMIITLILIACGGNNRNKGGVT